MEKTRKAIIYSLIANFGTTVISFTTTILVARLLTPEEIGTFSIASALVVVMAEFRILGAAGYVIREKVLSEEKIRIALGLTLLISWGFGCFILASSYSVAEYYAVKELAAVFSILSIGFFLAPFSSIPFAIYSRNLDFKTQLNLRLISNVVAFFVTMLLIYLEFSFYALAIGQVIKELTVLAGVIYYWPAQMVVLPKFRKFKEVASFGVHVSVSNFIRRAAVSVPDMIIGKLGDTAQVAMFSRGLGFIQFLSQTPTVGVSPVALPYLSQGLHRRGDISVLYTRASILLGALVCPILGVASLCSLPAIRVFFGEQWDMAAPISSIVAIWGIVRTIHWFAADLLAATGNERVLIVKEILPFTCLVVGIIYAFPYGLEAIAWVFACAGGVEVLVSSYILHSFAGIRLTYFFKAWWSNLLVTSVCMFSTYVISLFVDFSNERFWLPIVVIASILPGIWLGMLAMTKNPLFGEIFGLVRRSK